MSFRDDFSGYGDRAEARKNALGALIRAVQTLATLDAATFEHPLSRVWLRVEREFAAAGALALLDQSDVGISSILAARLRSTAVPWGHVSLALVDDRIRDWRQVAMRKGSPRFRDLVSQIAPARGERDLVHLADKVAAALWACVGRSWTRSTVPASLDTLVASDRSVIDVADIALAIPFALRRSGATRALLPAVCGRISLLTGQDGDGLPGLERWFQSIETQAHDAHARLRLIERYTSQAARQLLDIRRPAALRRAVDLGLRSWAIWGPQFARVTGVEPSSAWRTLEQARELGLVVVVPGQSRSRGDGTLYTIPPWLQFAGLAQAPRGRPRAVGRRAIQPPAPDHDLTAALDEADDALAAIDAILARRTQWSA